MLSYIIRRLIYMVILIGAISIVGFVIIELPPGSFLEVRIAQLETQGQRVDEAQIAALKKQYDLDSPQYLRYLKWV